MNSVEEDCKKAYEELNSIVINNYTDFRAAIYAMCNYHNALKGKCTYAGDPYMDMEDDIDYLFSKVINYSKKLIKQ